MSDSFRPSSFYLLQAACPEEVTIEAARHTDFLRICLFPSRRSVGAALTTEGHRLMTTTAEPFCTISNPHPAATVAASKQESAMIKHVQQSEVWT
jgi:hypothetical protein